MIKIRNYDSMIRSWFDGFENEKRIDFILSKVASFSKDAESILDIGCGQGDALIWFNNKLSLNSCLGIDISERVISLMRKRSLDAVNADANYPLPFRDESFDIITLVSLLEHLEKQKETLNEVHRVLKPDGRVIIQIPNPYFPFDLHFFLPLWGYMPSSYLRKKYLEIANSKRNFYVNYISKRKLIKFALASDLKLIYTYSYHFPESLVPRSFRFWYSVYSRVRLSKVFPMGHICVFTKITESLK